MVALWQDIDIYLLQIWSTEVSTTAKSQSRVINHRGRFIVSEHKSKGKHFPP